ncbi:clathrin coat assembly protein AP180-like [Tasmannia lanceolata]|uniref:clathrin coat assembly protein AP180-like n=1 Tax=Tasmannia lanceolata TaxID=3420 RepID=UPI004064C43E
MYHLPLSILFPQASRGNRFRTQIQQPSHLFPLSKKKKKKKIEEKLHNVDIYFPLSTPLFLPNTMPSKLRKALGLVKDQTSISLAKISFQNSSTLSIAILKSTSHEELPVSDRHINQVLLLTSSSRLYASSSVHALSRRITRTHNWIVALKSISLIFRILQQGHPYFPNEILRSIKRGSNPLNLSNFSSNNWDFTSFVRTFALYVEERLDCTLMGKINIAPRTPGSDHRGRSFQNNVGKTKPSVLLDRIVYWERLLDRVLATRPTGAAKNNRLVQISLYMVVRESFDLYRDISDGLALVLESYFQLQYKYCVEAFHVCSKASKQFDELGSFYNLCKSLGVGRSAEYPSVQKISEKLLDTLDEFLKQNQEKPSLPAPKSKNKPGPELLHLPAPTPEDPDLKNPNSLSPSQEGNRDPAPESRPIEKADLIDSKETNATASSNISSPNLVLFNGESPPQQHQEQSKTQGWEIVLVESATNMSKTMSHEHSMGGGFDSGLLNNLYGQASLYQHHHYYHHNYSNPFLPSNNSFSTFSISAPSPPTFCANNPDQRSTLPAEEDPFSPAYQVPSMRQHLMVHQQQYWLQHQTQK